MDAIACVRACSKQSVTSAIISFMEPVTTVTTAWTIAKTAGEISKKLYEFGKSLKDRDAKRQVDEITDELRELKHQASQLEEIGRASCRERVEIEVEAGGIEE